MRRPILALLAVVAAPPLLAQDAELQGGRLVTVIEDHGETEGCDRLILAGYDTGLRGSTDPSFEGDRLRVCVRSRSGFRTLVIPADSAARLPREPTGSNPGRDYRPGTRLRIWLESAAFPTNPPYVVAWRVAWPDDGLESDSTSRSEPVALFNGRDLQGWRIHGTERWYVEDGELVGASGPDEGYGYLATEASYRDFSLTLEFRQEADGNSGVFFRSRVDGTRVSGWQVEIAPPGLFTGGVYESYGRGWLVKPDPELDGVLRMGAWNTLRIDVVGDRVRTWLNGVPMVDFRDPAIGEAMGRIALQIHDGGGIEMRWRDLRIRELSPP